MRLNSGGPSPVPHVPADRLVADHFFAKASGTKPIAESCVNALVLPACRAIQAVVVLRKDTIPIQSWGMAKLGGLRTGVIYFVSKNRFLEVRVTKNCFQLSLSATPPHLPPKKQISPCPRW